MVQLHWLDRLEDLRREQNPARYSDERPVLRIPLDGEPPAEPSPEDQSDDDRGVIIIEM